MLSGDTQNPNFIATLDLVDGGLGLGFNAWRHNAMYFEAWHRRAKDHARQGMGKSHSHARLEQRTVP